MVGTATLLPAVKTVAEHSAISLLQRCIRPALAVSACLAWYEVLIVQLVEAPLTASILFNITGGLHHPPIH